MARRILSWKTLNKEYGKLSQQFRDTIESTVKKILKKEGGVLIRFTEQVLTHLISDNTFSNCVSIQLGDDGSLTFQIVESAEGIIKEYDETLDEMDCASYYELLLALNEKSYVVEKEL